MEYQLHLSAYVGTLTPHDSVSTELEAALQPRRQSRLKPEHARKFFFTHFARGNKDECLRPLVEQLLEAASNEKELRGLQVKSWSYGLETQLFAHAAFRLGFLRWFRGNDVLQQYVGPSRSAMLRLGKELQSRAKRRELQTAVHTFKSVTLS